MKILNPFYTLVTVVVIFIISIILLNNQSQKLINQQNQNKQYEQLALKYNKLNKAWKNRSKTIKAINYAIKTAKIKNVNITKNQHLAKIQINNTTSAKIDKFLQKILNETIMIKKLSFSNRSLTMEVGY
jgi:hypothetical protein